MTFSYGSTWYKQYQLYGDDIPKFFIYFLWKSQEVMLIFLADKSEWTHPQDLFSEGHCFLLPAQHINLFMLR